MKNLLKKYYKLDEETKDMLPFLYMYHELLSSLNEHKKVEIKNTRDKDILLQTIIKCWYSTKQEPSDITNKILDNLEEQNINIDDLENMDLDDLDNIIEDDEVSEDGYIIDEFEYSEHYCIFCKVQNEFFLILTKDDHSDVIVFESLKDAFCKIIDEHFLNKILERNTKYVRRNS